MNGKIVVSDDGQEEGSSVVFDDSGWLADWLAGGGGNGSGKLNRRS